MSPHSRETDLFNVVLPPNIRFCVAAIATTWLLAFLGPLSMFLLIVVPAVFIYSLAQRRWKTAALYLLVLPAIPVIAVAVVDYQNGSAKIRGFGHPGPGFHNEDQLLRCSATTGGCLVIGNEWLYTLPYNLTLAAMVRTYGYMPGSYDGPYPTEEEAKQAVVAAKPIDAQDIRNGNVRIGNRTIRVDTAEAAEWTAEYESLLKLDPDRFDWEFHQPIPPITCVLFDERCLIVAIPGRDDYEDGKFARSFILIDGESGRSFAIYREGHPSHRLTAQWRKS